MSKSPNPPTAMPPAAGLRPNPTPLRNQEKSTRGGDLLPAGTSPRREEITT
jgi:hypothetical protein